MRGATTVFMSAWGHLWDMVLGPFHRHHSLPPQKMAYTIHEIPVFIAMGVVGKAPQDWALPRAAAGLRGGPGYRVTPTGLLGPWSA